jgi:carbamoyl-phosphate synthase large subunit
MSERSMTDAVDGVVVVTGVGGGVGESVLRALRLSKHRWRVVGLDAELWGAGLYACHTGYRVPPARDEEYINSLMSIIRSEGASVVIPGSDPELPALAAHRDSLRDAGVIPLVGGTEAVRLCRDKLAGARFFQEHGLPFVRTVPIREAETLVEEVGFPLVVKPVGGSASRGVAVVFDDQELARYSDREDLVVQEYLVPATTGRGKAELRRQDVERDGILRQEHEISVQVLHDHEGHYLQTFTSRNVLHHGVPVQIDPWPAAPAVEPVARKMAELLMKQGLMGPCNFQCKLTEAGPVFFEINPRFTGITAVRAAMGFNEVEAVLRRAVLGEDVEAVRATLRVPGDLLCIRYITEFVFARDELEMVKRAGRVEGHGWSTTL